MVGDYSQVVDSKDGEMAEWSMAHVWKAGTLKLPDATAADNVGCEPPQPTLFGP
jgi:hypothetical protein